MQALLLANLGTTHLLLNGPMEAESSYTQALAVAENRMGAAHPLVGRILSLQRGSAKADDPES
jgi:hypothetical protein